MTVDLELLTREELDAILSEVDRGLAGASGDARLAAPFRRDRSRERQEPVERAPELRRAVGRFAESWGKQLANRYQRRIACSLIAWEEQDLGSVMPGLLPTDCVALFELEPGGQAGFALFGRPLAFTLLALSFGGRRSAGVAVPERAYTRIEQRFLHHLTAQLMGEFEATCGAVVAMRPRVKEVVGRDELGSHAASKLVLASLHVSSVDFEGRVRVALPQSWAFASASREVEPRPSGAHALEGTVVDLPVRVCAEVGYADIGLRRLASLQPGDVLELRRSAPDGFLVRVAGRPKFRAVSGSVGGRLAVQVVDRIDERGGVS
ncbi:MAG: FliM/FliN family flagellar motor switch protein [Myxococcota bacterium]|nr:FliM/FliN family flagellar motor switch protein [Myxococcota bacterium]